jgi:hypothetical protein
MIFYSYVIALYEAANREAWVIFYNEDTDWLER